MDSRLLAIADGFGAKPTVGAASRRSTDHSPEEP
jgi:hypothetical protein